MIFLPLALRIATALIPTAPAWDLQGDSGSIKFDATNFVASILLMRLGSSAIAIALCKKLSLEAYLKLIDYQWTLHQNLMLHFNEVKQF